MAAGAGLRGRGGGGVGFSVLLTPALGVLRKELRANNTSLVTEQSTAGG